MLLAFQGWSKLIKKYFREGQECFLAGKSVKENPYSDEDSEAHKSWEKGWDHEWFAKFRADAESRY